MLTLPEATIMITKYLKNLETTPPIDLKLLEESTKEFELGWVFFYQSKEFVETGEIFSSLAGNGAIIVNKYDSSIHQTGSAHPVEHYINEYLRSVKKT